MICEAFSLSHICSKCQKTLLSPALHKRKILGSIPVYSFYPYDAIESLLLTKHTDVGFYIYTLLAKNSFSKFANEWNYDSRVASIGIDDNSKNGYSHTAVLNRALKSTNITPYFGKLRAQNPYKYAGKNMEERLINPRNFNYLPFKEEEVILVDDIVTTGSTLTEAVETLGLQGKKVILCLTLSDAENR
ncbi:MAG: phosphoribosyltransferase family protein [Sulfuricurvum sp.]|nr:phosphoribosyltransferase family protein [Sulfuricurvum sp.]